MCGVSSDGGVGGGGRGGGGRGGGVWWSTSGLRVRIKSKLLLKFEQIWLGHV